MKSLQRFAVFGFLLFIACAPGAHAAKSKLQKALDELNNSKLDAMESAIKFEKAIDTDVDVAESALLLEKQIDPKLDVKKYLTQLDKMVGEVKMFTGGKTDPRQKINILRQYLFSNFGMKYDFSDPFAEKRSNFTLSGILSTKKGSCVTMPLLFLVMSQRLGYPIHVVLLPQHMFLRYSAIPAVVFDLEVTSDGDIFKPAGHYANDKSYGVTEEGLKSGSYMKDLTYKETLSVLLSYSSQFFFYKKNDFDKGFRFINAAIKLRENSANLYLGKAQMFNRLRLLAQSDRNVEWENRYFQFASEYGQKAKALGFTSRDEKWKKEYKQMMSELNKQETSSAKKGVM